MGNSRATRHLRPAMQLACVRAQLEGIGKRELGVIDAVSGPSRLL
jgi:hypothetical protein